MSKRMKLICFVDNEEAEIRRFKDNLGEKFIIGAGITIESALEDLKSTLKKLKKSGRKKPDLYVLDMYFQDVIPPERSTEEMIKELHQKREEFLSAKINFYRALAESGQSSEEGFKLVDKLKEKKILGKPKYVFFTRKGTLEDAQRAYDYKIKALRVIKKPDPKKEEKEGVDNINSAYDIAFKNNAGYIADKFKDVIKSISFWGRYKKFIYGFISGIIASVIGGLIIIFISGLFSNTN